MVVRPSLFVNFARLVPEPQMLKGIMRDRFNRMTRTWPSGATCFFSFLLLAAQLVQSSVLSFLQACSCPNFTVGVTQNRIRAPESPNLEEPDETKEAELLRRLW
jgi:hypothetical protein